jgi:plastocyanin
MPLGSLSPVILIPFAGNRLWEAVFMPSLVITPEVSNSSSKEGSVSLSARLAPTPREAETATLLHLQLLPALFLCLAIFCFLAVVGNIQFSVGSVHSGPPNLLAAPNSTSTALAAMAPAPTGTLNGRVTYEGTPKKYKPIDMSTEPTCAKFYTSSPMPEISVTGPQNSLQNVVVYISRGAPDESFAGPVIHLNQRGCRYAPHIISVQSGQEIWVQNDDSVTHSVHPMARANAEWNRSQPPGSPPVVIRYDQPEFVRVKCELHSWMRGVVAVFKNSHHAVTDNAGTFTLTDLPPGKYTVTAWHELYGTQSKEIIVTPGDNSDLNFVFKVAPY